MTAIVADPFRDRIYFTSRGIEMLNTDGTGRRPLISNPGGHYIVSLDVDLKNG